MGRHPMRGLLTARYGLRHRTKSQEPADTERARLCAQFPVNHHGRRKQAIAFAASPPLPAREPSMILITANLVTAIPHYSRRQLFAKAAIASSRVTS
jgi:hypothetical protein